MPFKAEIDGKEVFSFDMNDIEWKTLKDDLFKDKVKIKLPCCNQNGFLRISKNGIKHFIHAKSTNNCDWQPETLEHLNSKLEIIKACRKAGWKATTEYSESNWRADVLAEYKTARIAFEVQWSPQTYEVTIERQNGYSESGVKGCWFFRKIPTGFKVNKEQYKSFKEIPYFELNVSDIDNISINFNNKQSPIKDFVSALLNRKLKFRDNYKIIPKQDIDIIFFDVECPICHASQHAYTTNNTLQTFCNTRLPSSSIPHNKINIDFHPSIINIAQDIVKANDYLKMGEIKNRFGPKNVFDYKTFGCYKCDAIISSIIIDKKKEKVLLSNDLLIFSRTVDIGEYMITGNHWCYSDNGNFCDNI